MNLQDSVAVITGGASGLGKATVEKFVSAGGRVAIFDIDEEAGTALAQRLSGGARFAKVNVTEENGPFPLADFNKILQVNLVGAFKCTAPGG
jgi:NAD(P)-dependent dehydrogenase (short-subunit alcohol dehydrogenase family)